MAATPTQPDLRLHKQLSLIMGESHCTSSNVTSIVFSADLPTIRCRCGELFDSFHCQRCRDDGNPGRTDIHDVAKHEAVKMFASAGCRRTKVEPRASGHSDDNAVIVVEGFGDKTRSGLTL